jgi:endogenous inhibitor of DNA gyrase (YacG/DUF329 family)
MIIDLRTRCARKKCHKLIRKGKKAHEDYKRYYPYCSYHCQEWANLEDAMEYMNIKKRLGLIEEHHG